jgi:hypothetical protein
VYEALRETASHERQKIHDIIMQGVKMALKKRGYPSVEDLKAGKIAFRRPELVRWIAKMSRNARQRHARFK